MTITITTVDGSEIRLTSWGKGSLSHDLQGFKIHPRVVGLGNSEPSTVTKYSNMGVSKNSGTPKSSNLIGFSIINHPFWGTPIFGNTHIPWLWGKKKSRFPFQWTDPHLRCHFLTWHCPQVIKLKEVMKDAKGKVVKLKCSHLDFFRYFRTF